MLLNMSELGLNFVTNLLGTHKGWEQCVGSLSCSNHTGYIGGHCARCGLVQRVPVLGDLVLVVGFA